MLKYGLTVSSISHSLNVSTEQSDADANSRSGDGPPNAPSKSAFKREKCGNSKKNLASRVGTPRLARANDACRPLQRQLSLQALDG
jgi:hypothetical protein